MTELDCAIEDAESDLKLSKSKAHVLLARATVQTLITAAKQIQCNEKTPIRRHTGRGHRRG